MNEKRPPRKRRRLFSFTLRTLLIAMTVFGVWLGWRIQRANRQREAVKAIQAHSGGPVCYGFMYSTQQQSYWVGVPPPAPRWLIDLVGIDFLHNVETANLTKWDQYDIVESSPPDLAARLEYLPHLKTLSLQGDQASDSVFASIA